MKYARWFVITVAAMSMFFLYAIMPMHGVFAPGAMRTISPKFDTPDETINYFFADHFAKTGSLAYREPLNAQFTNPIMFMRWMQSPGMGSAVLFPGTFVGFIILAGAVAKLFGSYAALFITPIFGVGCVFLMYWITKQLFDVRTARWSALILALLPPFFYYASRTMFHTIPFLFFVLLGVTAYLRATNSHVPNVGIIMLSAFGFGTALFIRFADIWWVGLTILMLLVARPIGWKKSVLFSLLAAGVASVTFLVNQKMYGNAFTFGYPIPGFSASDATVASSSLWRFVLPFGFRPNLIWHTFVQTLWQPYSGFMVLSLFGFIAMAIRFWNTHRRTIMVVTGYGLLITVYVLSLYGSWSFSDSPTPGLVTIGSSYTRYFLPLLVMMVPGAAFLIAKSLSMLRSRAMRVAGTVCMLIIFAAQIWSIAWASDEGLSHVTIQTESYQSLVLDLQNRGATPADIFLVHRGEDKILFPDFSRVINIDYLPEDMIRKNVENYSGSVWVSDNNHQFIKKNPYVR